MSEYVMPINHDWQCELLKDPPWAECWCLHRETQRLREMTERGRQLASEREDLIDAGADPNELLVPAAPPSRRAFVPTPLPLSISEADFQRTVTECADLMRWTWCHFRAAQTGGRWSVALAGHAGCPDLIMVRGGFVLLVELKTEKGKVRQEQVEWLADLGPAGRLWRPSDWNSGVIFRTLRDYRKDER